jgi:hypothetical protein
LRLRGRRRDNTLRCCEISTRRSDIAKDGWCPRGVDGAYLLLGVLAEGLLQVFAVLSEVRIALRYRQQKIGLGLVVSQRTGERTTGTAQRAAHQGTGSERIDNAVHCFIGVQVEDGVGSDLENFLHAFSRTFNGSTASAIPGDTARATFRGTLEDIHGPALGLGYAGNIARKLTEETASQQKLGRSVKKTANCTDHEGRTALTLATTSHGFAVGCAGLLEDV